jgi:zinc transport system permease protein
MIDLLSHQFMQNALAAGILLSIVLAVVSFFVVLRHHAFIGVGIAHSAFGGVAAGSLFGFPPLLSAIVFSVLVANGVSIISKHKNLGVDSAIGIFFSLAMALGVICIGLSDTYNTDLFGYLFGNILAISREDLLVIAVLGSVVLLSVALFFRQLLFITFDSEVALVSGMPVAFLDHFFLTVLSITIVISMKITGIILVSALLVIPGAAAAQIFDHYTKMIVASIGIALFSTVGGLVLSYYLDLASGAAIVTLACVVFFIAFSIGKFRNKS